MQDTINDYTVLRDLKKRPPITRPHSILRGVVAQALHVSLRLYRSGAWFYK